MGSFASPIKNHIVFYAVPLDKYTVDSETVLSQNGRVDGGWLTSDIFALCHGEPNPTG